MRKPYYHRHRRPMLTAVKLFLLIIAGYLGWVAWQHRPQYHFNADEIIQNSILRQKTFSKMPQEIKVGHLTAWLIEDNSVPIISVSFSFRFSGYAYDPQGQLGLADLAAELLPLGAGHLPRAAFQEQLELNGIKLGFSASRDDFNGFLVTPAINRTLAFQSLRDVLLSPQIAAADLKVAQDQQLLAIKTQQERPDGELSLAFNNILYGKHPYGRNPLGRAEDISGLTTVDLRGFVRKAFAQDNLIIGIAGDISVEDARQAILEMFGSLPVESARVALSDPQLNLQSRVEHIDRQSAQTIGRFAARGVTRSSPDFYPLYIANHIFGGAGLTSRLSREAREKQGLTYGIYTYLSTDEQAPLLLGGFSATPENYPKAQDILRQEWQKFAAEGATAEELKAAQDYLLASYNLRFDSTDGLADMLVAMQKYALGLDFLQKRNDYIKNVSLTDVNRAAAEYFGKLPFEVNIGTNKTKE